ncbi:lytic murein transglycosylase [Thiothrix subterranea]|uniref:Lytic murein transglycosylase n=1 Tax=Thiothrix subterranea TaxID=2735563 RepID=A0AA51MKP5_9GAMM|nr:lytic murein transglycosylase [Thiothrix subterranea]MDQ5770550.1 lytic murein transglycosylase [Thiothrix subterranea]WML85738.1 lytic murein transglycosylase [Thiothrix subterranea]
MNQKWLHGLPVVLLLVVVLFGYSTTVDSAFDAWKQQFRQVAIKEGIHAETVDRALRGLVPDKKVLRLESHQPEFTKTVWEYLETAASTERIANGQKLLRDYAPLLQRIHAQYGVQPEYLLAIWGLESNFGSHTGRYSIVRSLATLAYAGEIERREFWQKQLIAALRIVQNGDMPPISMQGSWAGAIGHTQFIPTTFESYAVDFDGDGHRDLVNSIPDALASTANYLASSGWERDQPWGFEVRLPAKFDWSQADVDFWLPLNIWGKIARVTAVNGQSLDSSTSNAFVLLPAGYRGPAFLALRNFDAILKYNNAQNYALAVGYLGDRIQGKPPLLAMWPKEDVPLSHAEKVELQTLLTAAGYSTDGLDGKLGPNTRAAVRRWQMDNNLPADGYATLQHLNALRQRVAEKTAN